jgi:uncharacterized membrane protein HdeD (DUF308 family)
LTAGSAETILALVNLREVEHMLGILGSLYQRTWWSLLIRGIVAVVFGIVAIAWPDRVLELLVSFFGIFVLVIGIVATTAALTHRAKSRNWLLMLAPGLAGIVIGIITVAWPAVTTVVLVYLIAIWALVHGIGEIHNALRLRKDVEGEWMPILIGIVSVVFGIVLIVRPLAAGAVVTWLFGLFVLIMGILWLIMAFRARRWQKQPE